MVIQHPYYPPNIDLKLVDILAGWLGVKTPRRVMYDCLERFHRDYWLMFVTLDNRVVDILLYQKHKANFQEIHRKRYADDPRVGFRSVAEVNRHTELAFLVDKGGDDSPKPESVSHIFGIQDIVGDVLGEGHETVAPFFYSLTSWATQELGKPALFAGILRQE